MKTLYISYTRNTKDLIGFVKKYVRKTLDLNSNKSSKQGAPDSTGACLMGRLPHTPLRSTPNGVGLRSLMAAKFCWSHIFLF